jgi:hypothetical protein
MPHIPEAELHAYLDQALNRLRCVEIESHLAECTPCRATRDEIAALRDRTTAMLTRLAPRGTVPPPITEIRRRAAARVFQRERVQQRAAWAASVLVALGIGWAGASYLAPPSSTRTVAGPTTLAPVATAPGVPVDTATPRPLAPPPQMVAGTDPRMAEPPALERRPESATRPAARHRPSQAPARKPERSGPAEFATVGGIQKDGQIELRGVWRNLSWDRAKQQAGNTPARIDGLPITQVQVQAGDSGRKSLMVVAQQLASGEVIRTIEGPVSDVSALLNTRPGEAPESSGSAAGPGARSPSSPGSTLAFRHGDRMFAVTGSLPSDSLRAMMRRLNLMSRVR